MGQVTYQGKSYKAGEPFEKGGESFVIIENEETGAQRVYASDIGVRPISAPALVAPSGPVGVKISPEVPEDVDTYNVIYNDTEHVAHSPHINKSGVPSIMVSFPEDGESRAIKLSAPVYLDGYAVCGCGAGPMRESGLTTHERSASHKAWEKAQQKR